MLQCPGLAFKTVRRLNTSECEQELAKSQVQDKNEKIQDMSSKLEETEINLEEALQNISASKGQDKEKKDLLFSWRVSTELHVPLVSN